MAYIRPLHDRVLVKRIESEEKTSGGLYIPDSAKEKPLEGEVVAVGSGKILENGSIRPISVGVGDKVLFAKYSETEVNIGNDKLLLLKEDDLLGVVL